MANEVKYTNQHELQIKTKELIDNVQRGDHYVVLRYSKPVGILLSTEEYCRLTHNTKKCGQCQRIIKKAIKEAHQEDEK